MYIKLDIEGSECDALDGMRTFLSGSARVVGMLLELSHARTRQCCRSLITAPSGPLYLLHTRHRLCPHAVSRVDVVEATATPLEHVCSLAAAKAWNLLWQPCNDSAP